MGQPLECTFKRLAPNRTMHRSVFIYNVLSSVCIFLNSKIGVAKFLFQLKKILVSF